MSSSFMLSCVNMGCGCGLWLGAGSGLWVWASWCMTGFRSRSFENNWNIYKLLAHQKVSKEKVRWCERQSLRAQGLPMGSRELRADSAGLGLSLLCGV